MSQTFIPGPDTARAYRDALACFGTGVTVITVATPDGPMGITANSFASVSLDPPLVLWSPAKGSRRYPAYIDASHFVVHILGVEQGSIADGFVAAADAFSELDWAPNDHGAPVIQGCLSHFECTTHAIHDAGDHSIVLGRVIRASHRAGKGLLFKQGQYGRFAPNG
jgi:flavin reductase (DIM6/NTAB) family NADH-FMN oxidoreductase RutF